MQSTTKSIIAIINPISGIHSKERVPGILNKILGNNKNFKLEIVFTEYPGHATVLARQAVKRNTDYVLAVGGDGTINETAKALVHTNTALGIIPFGSGNGLARSLNIPLDLEKSIKMIETGKVINIDYCKADDHIFFCTAGVGFDALISKKFAEDGHRGKFTYLKNVLAEYINYKPHTYNICIDGQKFSQEAFVVTCANASQYGNNAYIAPKADMQDGLMDITILKPFNHIEAPLMAMQLFTKQLPLNSHSTTIRGKSLRIKLEDNEVMHVDGEPVPMQHEINIDIVPAGLKVIVR